MRIKQLNEVYKNLIILGRKSRDVKVTKIIDIRNTREAKSKYNKWHANKQECRAR